MKTRIVIATVLLVSASALAQVPPDPNTPPPPDPDSSPPPPPPNPTGSGPDVVPATREAGAILPNLFPSRLGFTVDIRGDYTHFSDDAGLFGDLFLIGFTFHGQYIWPQGYGAYARLPYYYASANDNSDKGIGNLEVGGLYRLQQGERSEILLRGGFAVNSAGQSGGTFAPFASIGPRLYDAFLTGGDTNWASAAAEYHHDEGNIHLGGALGFDFPLDSDSANFDGLGKLAVSAGFGSPGSVGVSVGYVLLVAIGNDSDDNTLSGLNVAADFPINPGMKAYVGFGLPDLENNLDQFDIFGVGAGIRIAAK